MAAGVGASHDGGQLRGWLARVARNLAANRWRGEARRREREEPRPIEQPAEEELEARFELRKELVGALDGLNQLSREAILLRYFEGLAPREIAKRQGIPLATVKTRLRRGLAQLREALDKQHGGDRASWMSAVTALAVPVDSGVGVGALVVGGIVMGTMMKVSAAILVAAASVYCVTRTPQNELPQIAVAELAGTQVEHPESLERGAVGSPADPATDPERRSLVTDAPSLDVSAIAGANVLRVVLQGITEEEARLTTVRVRGLDEGDEWPADSWLCQGLISEFNLDPFLASVEQHKNLRVGELEVEVKHPHYLSERIQVSLLRDVEPANGKIVHEVPVRLVQPEFWPEFTLAVRDAHTRAHLENIELRFSSGVANAMWGRNGTNTLLDGGLRSPIVLMGGGEANDQELVVAGLALSPAAGETPRLVELGGYYGGRWRASRFGPERGVIVSARAPGYAWGSTSLDVSKGERELLLEPAAELSVRLANVQLERYAALETVPMLCVYWIRPDGGNQYVHFGRLDETLESEGLRLDSLAPGGYRVAVELGGGGVDEATRAWA